MNLDDVTVARVRSALLEAGFTADGVLARLGPVAFTALSRDQVVPVVRALETPSSGDPTLDQLIRAFLLGQTTTSDAWPAGLLADLSGMELLQTVGGEVRPLFAIHPYGEPDTDWYIVSDLGQPVAPDHVLGLGGASLTLAQITPRRACARVLDLGCGAGVQSLHAARHGTHLMATDTNPRALELTAMSMALSGVAVEGLELKLGSLFEPVEGQRFDLIVSNPPFVISPGHRFTYRDAGMPADELSRTVVRNAARHLTAGGMAAVLVNWLHIDGQDWQDRVASWVADTGVSAWIVSRDQQSVPDYCVHWLADAGLVSGPDFDVAFNEWLDAFADQQAHAIGFGWVVLVAPEPEDERPVWLVVEDLADSARLPRGDEVSEFLGNCAEAEAIDAVTLLGMALVLVPGTLVGEEFGIGGDGSHFQGPATLGRPGAVGPGGWRSAVRLDGPVLAALLDESGRPIGERLDLAAEDAGVDPLDLLGSALVSLRELLRAGIVSTG